MKPSTRTRSILHLDLDPFFVSVERSFDPGLRGVPVIVGGGGDPHGIVAAASEEARTAGVRPGQGLSTARRLCPAAVVRPGDLEAYARVSDEITSVLLSWSRRVERPSSDEAYVDLTPESAHAAAPVTAAEAIKDEIHRRLRLDASLGLASSRIAARVASRWARPRGLLLVLPGYEASFLAAQPLAMLPELPPHLEAALQRGGFETLGDLAGADPARLAAAAGAAAALRLKEAASGAGEAPVAVAAPPSAIQEEATIRDRRSDREALLGVVDGLVARAWRRLRPFSLGVGTVSVEVRRGAHADRRSETFDLCLHDEQTAREAALRLADALLDPAANVRAVQVRLARLAPPSSQAPLFPESTGPLRRSAR